MTEVFKKAVSDLFGKEVEDVKDCGDNYYLTQLDEDKYFAANIRDGKFFIGTLFKPLGKGVGELDYSESYLNTLTEEERNDLLEKRYELISIKHGHNKTVRDIYTEGDLERLKKKLDTDFDGVIINHVSEFVDAYNTLLKEEMIDEDDAP